MINPPSLAAALGIVLLTASAIVDAPPLLKVLEKFTAPTVPAMGPAEKPAPLKPVPVPPGMPTWPGKGLAQHPFLFGGEGYNAITLFKDGKSIWTYQTGPGWEIDDCWMLSNGNILYTRMQYAEEVTPDKKVVWHWDSPPGTQSHSVQPIGLDRVLLVNDGIPAPEMIMFNITTGTDSTGKIEWRHPLETANSTDIKTVHGQIRNARMTSAGTYLVPYMDLHKVVEYDKDWKPILTLPAAHPWAAIRVPNGDILVAGNEEGWVREFDRAGKVVWEVTRDQLPGIELQWVQGLCRLFNGDTIICTNGIRKGDIKTSVQLVEVSPSYKVVWVLQDWAHLAPASWIQLLDEPGIPERGQVLR